MTTRYLAAAFFIPKEDTEQSMELLLKKAGAIKVHPPKKGDWAWYCQWAGMICDAAIHNQLPLHQLLIIYFSQSRFLKGIPDEDGDLPLEKDGNLQLALTFKNACETLQPEVAYIATHTYNAEFDSIINNAERIETYDADRIAADAGLLFLDGIIADCLTYPLAHSPQDALPVKSGLLVFSGKGSDRWW